MEAEKQIGPDKISFTIFLLKLLATGFGGMVGSLVLVLIFVLASTLLAPLTTLAEMPQDFSISPVFVFLLLIMIFLSTTAGNILSSFLLALTERRKYTRTASAIYQISVFSIIIFMFMVPVYFITATVDFTLVAYAVALHIILSAFTSSLTLEIVSNYKHSLVSLYGLTLSIIVSAAILFGMAAIITNLAILLFAALPVIWGSIGFVQTLTTMAYGWLARLYDKDFLSTKTVYGMDYGKEVEDEELEVPAPSDEEGADFLRKNQ